MSTIDNEIPQWKRDLIARLRNQNKRTATAVGNQQQLCTDPPQRPSVAVGCAVQQPSLTCGGRSETVAESVATVSSSCRDRVVEKCKVNSKSNTTKMVQERAWEWNPFSAVEEPHKNGDCDSDSSEDLRYGPGIVNKLRNKYLSLALRESNAKTRPSILPMRKAASLENILDDIPNDTVSGTNRLFQSRLNGSNDTAKNVPNRYRNTAAGFDLKRARSVEAISRSEDHDNILGENVTRPKSLHEEMLIIDTDGSDKPSKIIVDKKMLEIAESKPYSHRINRPKRITPIMSEKEKPPIDVVKQAKLIFEKRPEQRTRPPQQTGEVAAKVATYKSIIIQAKAAKKPPIKVKPVVNDKAKTNGILSKPKIIKDADTEKTSPQKIVKDLEFEKVMPTPSLPSPIPDVSRDERNPKKTSLSETPDLIMTSSPLPSINSTSFRITVTEHFIKEEIRYSDTSNSRLLPLGEDTTGSLSPVKPEEEISVEKINPQSLTNIKNSSNTMTFNFANSTNKVLSHLPKNTHSPPLEPLKIEINGISGAPKIVSPPPKPSSDNKNQNVAVTNTKPNLTIREIEKNLKNTAKTLEQPHASVSIKSVEEVIKIQVPRVKKPPREPESNSIVFKFTDRKDVPDYVHNDGTTRVARIEKPKVGEGGIILLPGASIDESFTDEDEEIMRSLEAPPSPCDVTFVNDNILIDGKSSLRQKTKKVKMKISFVEAGPDIYEYPSESSLLVVEDTSSAVSSSLGHTVPSLSGTSSLASYTPKNTEEFQPGITRSVQNIPTESQKREEETSDELILQEIEKPILFSAGTNSDILF